MNNGNGHRNGGSCCHADPATIATALYQVFLRRQLPEGLTIRDQKLLVGSLVLPASSGKGGRCNREYVLSRRGEEVLTEILEKKAIK